MSKNSNFVFIILLLSLFALPLAGCDSPPWEGTAVLVVKVNTPEDGATVDTTPVTVTGHVGGTQAKGAQLRINNSEVPLKDKNFSHDVALAEGKNVIDLIASTGGFKKNIQIVVNYSPAKK